MTSSYCTALGVSLVFVGVLPGCGDDSGDGSTGTDTATDTDSGTGVSTETGTDSGTETMTGTETETGTITGSQTGGDCAGDCVVPTEMTPDPFCAFTYCYSATQTAVQQDWCFSEFCEQTAHSDGGCPEWSGLDCQIEPSHGPYLGDDPSECCYLAPKLSTTGTDTETGTP